MLDLSLLNIIKKTFVFLFILSLYFRRDQWSRVPFLSAKFRIYGRFRKWFR